VISGERSAPAQNRAQRSRLSDRGATAVEYGILLGLIAAVIIGVVVIVGHQVSCAFQSVSTQLASHNNGASCSGGNGGDNGNGNDGGDNGGHGGHGGHGGG
jgi:pilus assembly protein Flp/PilA